MVRATMPFPASPMGRKTGLERPGTVTRLQLLNRPMNGKAVQPIHQVGLYASQGVDDDRPRGQLLGAPGPARSAVTIIGRNDLGMSQVNRYQPDPSARVDDVAGPPALGSSAWA